VDGRVRTRSLEAHVVDHCNLTCAECCSLSPYLPRWAVEPADLARDVAWAARVVAPRVFKLVGGEPLLHPDLAELVRIVRASGVAPRVSITTNGLLLAAAPDALWEAVDAITISLYPRPALADDERAKIRARAEQHGVELNWKVQDDFVVMDRAEPSRDAAVNAAVYDACWIRERCHMLRDARFYTCTRPVHFHAFHRGALDFTRDGLALDGLDGPGLLAYLERGEALEACAHCHGGAARMVPHRLLTRAELLRHRR
jgi:hypothetical protein